MQKHKVKLFFTIILLLFSKIDSFGQGFDWQYSARLPFNSPKLFYGMNANFGLVSSKGTLTFLEDKILCPKFKDGEGNNFAVGLNFEYWNKDNQSAYIGSINYLRNYIDYKFLDFVPLSNDIVAKYETKLALDYSTIVLSAGYKYRILESHFTIAASLDIGIHLTNDFVVKEKILGPPEVPPFSTNPPSYERNILNGEFNKFTLFNLLPRLHLGYDMQLGLGKYVTPFVSIGLPITKMLQEDDVTNFVVSAGLKTHFSL